MNVTAEFSHGNRSYSTNDAGAVLARSELFLGVSIRSDNSLHVCSHCFWLTVFFPPVLLSIYIVILCVHSSRFVKPNMTLAGASVFPTFHIWLISQIYFPCYKAKYQPAAPNTTRCGALLLHSVADSAFRCLPFLRRPVGVLSNRGQVQALQLLALQS